jgi:hypothetical protein
MNYSNPHLIRLLRGESSLSAARGIGVSTVLGVLTWAAIAGELWLVL